MKTIETITQAVDENIDKLAEVFNREIDDFFFTESELHSYFYHLCISDDIFRHRGYSLIHMEYPSPFKCSFASGAPFVIEKDIDSKSSRRAHIDCVIINPSFIDWLLDLGCKYGIEPLLGLSNTLFSSYMTDFYALYAEFYEKTDEPILAYAIEFKFIRRSFSGTKYPLLEINRDLGKLKHLRNFDKSRNKFDFVNRTKAVVFLGKESLNLKRKLRSDLKVYPDTDYRIVAREDGNSVT